MAVYYWLASDWQKIIKQHADKKLAHAYLLNGIPGIGKLDFARELASFVLCERVALGSVNHCGECKQCKLVEAETHPDLKFIRPEEGSSVLKVDAIRAMVEFFSQSSMQSGKKVAVLEPAEALNVNAANALLKTLEEPSGDSLIILVSHNAGQLLPTIRSRCQVIDMPMPQRDMSESWLKDEVSGADPLSVSRSLSLAHNAPLLAKAYLNADAYQETCKMLDELALCLKKQQLVSMVADRWSDDLSITRLQWVLQWIQNIIKLKFDDSFGSDLHQQKMFEHLAKTAPVAVLYELYDYTLKQIRLLQGTSNPNKNLLFEDVLIKFSSVMSRKGA